jgi:hypothetical protein
MALPDTLIVLLGRTLRGHHPEDSRCKQALLPELDGCTASKVLVDGGSLGRQADYRGDQIERPAQKPRKSKKHPQPHLSAVPKAAKTALSQVRIVVEQAIGGMKRYNILVHGFRNHKANFEDDVIGVCAGLWNFVLSY